MPLLHWLPRYVRAAAAPGADPADVRRVLGREPTTVEDFARKHREALTTLARDDRSDGG